VAGFLALSALLILTPGPNQALLATRVLQGGRALGWATIGGLVCGMAVHVVLALAGLSALLAASEEAFAAVQTVGGAYLAALGVLALVSAWRRREPEPRAAPRVVGRGAAWRDGLLSMGLNPKVGLFFVAVVPQFVEPGEGAAARIALLLCLYGALATGFWVVWLLAVDRLQAIVRRPPVRAALEATTGTVLLVLGLRLALL
jgi:threonine/homoserine/homoserine lactone efflux protein